MDYPVLNRPPDVVNGMVPHGLDGSGNATPWPTRIAAGAVAVTAAAYAAGNAVGALWSFAGCPAGGVLQSAILRDKAGNSASYDLFLFDSQPANANDKAAYAIGTDLAKAFGSVPFSGLVAGGTPGLINADGLAKAFKLGSGSTIWGILVTRGTPTYASTSDVSLELVFI